ncbi:hypothetical protein VMT65_22455 [Nocardia sp. CDC153]|uniref:phage tail protein n=1 Tax=Nocardia sp. CDC153 TaxID=3112167 RepID=UPI002DB77FCF|nr:hypothetical protein [Nocardia sp. CDC153]MEC3955812.1 hypothetical protein [Nocardia sp. CDC153]
MSSQGDAQFDAALRAALAASDPLDDGKDGKDKGGKQPDGKHPSEPGHPAATKPEKPTPPPHIDHPKGTRPTVHAPKRPVEPKRKPKRNLGGKLRAGAGLAGGLAMGAMSSGVDWRQAARDPKAALQGLKGAAVQAGKDKLAGMMDPANLPDTLSQAQDLAVNAKDKLGGKGKGKGTPDPHGADAKAITAETKSLKDKTTALKGDTKNLGEYDKHHQKMTEHTGKSSKGFNDLAKAHKESSGAQKNVEGATKNWGKSQDKLNGSMGKSTIGKIVQAIQAMIDVIVVLIANWDTVKKAFDTVKKTVLDPVGNFFKSVFSACLAPFKSIIDEVKGVFNGLGTGIGGIFDGVVHQVAVIVNAIGSVISKFDIKLPDWLGGASIGLGGLGNAMVGWASAHMADGGMVRGPGGPREDRVPIMASNGEFVVNAAATARHSALLEAINTDTLRVSGRDAQVVASLGLSRVKPAQALPGLVATRQIDRSTTINITTTQHESTYARAKAVAAQREGTYAAGRR